MIAQLTVGDTLNFLTSGGDYPASAGWGLTYKLIPRTTGPVITITSTAEDDDHRLQASAATTAAWTAGTYSWACQAINAGTSERQTLQTGVTLVLPDPGVVSNLDARSAAQIGLDNVRAVLRGTASQGVLSYSIAGRSLQRYSIAELIALESKLATDVKREQPNAGQRSKVHVRLSRA